MRCYTVSVVTLNCMASVVQVGKIIQFGGLAIHTLGYALGVYMAKPPPPHDLTYTLCISFIPHAAVAYM